MTFDEFDKFFDATVVEVRNMRDTKGKEYAHDADRFANFNRSAKELGVDPLVIWWVYTKKHMDSIVSYIQAGRKTYSTESIHSRFVDAITYLLLGAGMVEEGDKTK